MGHFSRAGMDLCAARYGMQEAIRWSFYSGIFYSGIFYSGIQASASISIRQLGLSSAATTTMVAAGRMSGEVFAVHTAGGLPVFGMGEV